MGAEWNSSRKSISFTNHSSPFDFAENTPSEIPSILSIRAEFYGNFKALPNYVNPDGNESLAYIPYIIALIQEAPPERILEITHHLYPTHFFL